MDRVPFFRRAFQSSPSRQMPSRDRAALIALFGSTDGANWERRSNWNTDAGLATWEGVKLNYAGRVVGLSLLDNNLHGIAMPSPRCEFSLTVPSVWCRHRVLIGRSSLCSLMRIDALISHV
ncbi:unnamed protein product [Ectocarpus sp. 12 AP-2014]